MDNTKIFYCEVISKNKEVVPGIYAVTKKSTKLMNYIRSAKYIWVENSGIKRYAWSPKHSKIKMFKEKMTLRQQQKFTWIKLRAKLLDH